MMGRVQEPFSGAARQRSGVWLADVAPLLSSATLTFLGILFEIAIAKQLGIAPRMRTMLVFVSGISILPLGAMTLQNWLERRAPKAGRLLEAANIWCSVAALVGLALVALACWLGKGGIEFWRKSALHVAEVSAVGYIALIAWLRPTCRTEKFLDRADAVIARWSSRSTQTSALVFAFAAALIALFKIEPDNRYFNPLFSFFVPTVPGGYPDRSSLLFATFTSALFVAIGACLLVFERHLAANHPARLPSAQRATLAIAIVASVFISFDFSFAADPFHYMTVVGPALHLLHGGGTLMVDTFSQYGPGPVVVTYLAFQLGPPSFAIANIAIQLCNLIFYGLFLIALWQSTRSRMTAVWFGLAFIAFWLAGWGNGQGNVNSAPSVLGARYLPIMLMAVALGGQRGARHSAITFLAGFLSSLWSIEAFIGSAALYAGSLALINLRDLTYARLARDLVVAALPMIAGLAALSVGTLVAAGSWPAFDIYLGFLSSYNPLAQFWSVPFDATFWGWLPILAAVAIAVAGCWLLTIDRRRVSRQATGDAWLQHVLPAAILTAVTGAYFAGRSVDFTVIIALLPFALLFVPAALWLAGLTLDGDRVATSLTAIAAAAVFWASIFSCLYVFRTDGAYSLLVQECRDMGRCTPSALGHGMTEATRQELALSPGTNIWALTDYDRTIVTEARTLIERYSGADAQITVLLGGSSGGQQMLSDIALMYARKWHTWPRSFTFSDELVPALVERILAAPVRPATGDLVLLRRDPTSLGTIERGILSRLRADGRLCYLEPGGTEVSGYRFWRHGEPSPVEACADRPDDGPHLAVPEHGELTALAELIERTRGARGPLSNGPLDAPALERGGIHVPESMRRKQYVFSFWGSVSMAKAADQFVIDLNNVPSSTCNWLLVEASHLAGVARVANSGALLDEQSTPIPASRAAELCAKNTGMVRIIVKGGG
ncbi:hypothetical protein [Bradyrhizobium diazoefficiens]|uniref:hypothetical protein n=1 Tax=Bradyrhizobium diazoefficiens TaxID=1355477 RepID=UPI002714CDF5|nr:hypothetical protein [Bradyrhizobium diazoefficiens]WLA54282.1 hypothetical protein QIH81_27460 [Bradyrhizobium diazoefficiens]